MPKFQIVKDPLTGELRIILVEDNGSITFSGPDHRQEGTGTELGEEALDFVRYAQGQNGLNDTILFYTGPNIHSLIYDRDAAYGSPEFNKNKNKALELKTQSKQIGGIMNYVSYLQYGGEAQLGLSDEELMALDQQKEKLLLEQFKLDPEGFLLQISEGGDPMEAVNFILNKAVEFQDEDAYQLIAPIAEKLGIALKKCGGIVRAKVKKSACGFKMKKDKKEVGGLLQNVQSEKCGGKAKKVKKAESGVPVTKTWSNQSSSFSIRRGASGCPCQYKKVGGRIIAVDGCTGMPMHKNGGTVFKFAVGGEVDKFEDPWRSIRLRNSTVWNYEDDEYFYAPTGNGGWNRKKKTDRGVREDAQVISDANLLANLNKANDYYTNWKGKDFKQNPDGTYSKFGSDDVYRIMKDAAGVDRYTTGGTGSTWNGSAWVKNGQTYVLDKDGKGSWSGYKTNITGTSGKTFTHQGDGFYTTADYPETRYHFASDGKTLIHNGGASDATWNSDSNTWERNGYSYDGTKTGSAVWIKNKPELTSGQLMFRNAGANELAEMDVSARKNWLLNGAGKDLNISFDRNQYTGTAAQNRALLAAYQNKMMLPEVSVVGNVGGASLTNDLIKAMFPKATIHLSPAEWANKVLRQRQLGFQVNTPAAKTPQAAYVKDNTSVTPNGKYGTFVDGNNNIDWQKTYLQTPEYNLNDAANNNIRLNNEKFKAFRNLARNAYHNGDITWKQMWQARHKAWNDRNTANAGIRDWQNQNRASNQAYLNEQEAAAREAEKTRKALNLQNLQSGLSYNKFGGIIS